VRRDGGVACRKLARNRSKKTENARNQKRSELTAARYDRAVAALGGHGEFVEQAVELPGAIERSLSSGKPACINLMIESTAAPVIRASS
jgi:thiamine pyrophosphate-dependent acetolactate synthase large subunit-like protein